MSAASRIALFAQHLIYASFTFYDFYPIKTTGKRTLEVKPIRLAIKHNRGITKPGMLIDSLINNSYLTVLWAVSLYEGY